MFDMIDQARTRLITSPSFTSDRAIAATLSEQTMDREIVGKRTPLFVGKQRHCSDPQDRQGPPR